ncbi:lipocalin family protein [Dyella marensis]|uniref:lipocalin family protein n=1 Tax=Dyella TaxID=231454 RepID=UPI0014477728|nr:apolipoprotein D and lipocalin family protein [Dyella sp. SG609]
MRIPIAALFAACVAAVALPGCVAQPPLPRAADVDLDRFMGDWYVIASIPTWLERDAYNAVESYARLPDGRIQTTFRYRAGGFGGAAKAMHPVGTVRAGTGRAEWGMQFVWPVKAQYVIAWLDPGYREVIVARSKRDYVWIMARTPALDDARYAALVRRVAAMGYDVSRLRRVPQRWPAQ